MDYLSLAKTNFVEVLESKRTRQSLQTQYFETFCLIFTLNVKLHNLTESLKTRKSKIVHELVLQISESPGIASQQNHCYSGKQTHENTLS